MTFLSYKILYQKNEKKILRRMIYFSCFYLDFLLFCRIFNVWIFWFLVTMQLFIVILYILLFSNRRNLRHNTASVESKRVYMSGFFKGKKYASRYWLGFCFRKHILFSLTWVVCQALLFGLQFISATASKTWLLSNTGFWNIWLLLNCIC